MTSPALRPYIEGTPLKECPLKEVRGDHRCLFDFPAHKNGFPLLHILNYIGTYQSAYGAGPGQVGAVGTFYGMGGGSSLPLGFDDEIWAKYQFGEYTGLRDATGRPYTRNVFRKPTEADGHLLVQALESPNLPLFGGAIVARAPAARRDGRPGHGKARVWTDEASF